MEHSILRIGQVSITCSGSCNTSKTWHFLYLPWLKLRMLRTVLQDGCDPAFFLNRGLVLSIWVSSSEFWFQAGIWNVRFSNRRSLLLFKCLFYLDKMWSRARPLNLNLFAFIFVEKIELSPDPLFFLLIFVLSSLFLRFLYCFFLLNLCL